MYESTLLLLCYRSKKRPLPFSVLLISLNSLLYQYLFFSLTTFYYQQDFLGHDESVSLAPLFGAFWILLSVCVWMPGGKMTRSSKTVTDDGPRMERTDGFLFTYAMD